jgi:hypothetical protein
MSDDADRQRRLGRERTRRWRARAAAGDILVTLLLDSDDIEALTAGKLLAARDSADPDAAADALRLLLKVLKGCRPSGR